MKINNAPKISKCKLSGEKDGTINDVVSKCSQPAQEEFLTKLRGKGDLLGIVQETEIWQYNRMEYAITRTCHRKWNIKFSGFIKSWPEVKPRASYQKKKKKKEKKKKEERKKERTCRLVEFGLPAVNRVEIKESEKIDKYLDLAGELKNCGTWRWRWYQL